MKTSKTRNPALALSLPTLCLALALLVSASPPASLDPLMALPSGPLIVLSLGNPARIMANALAFTRKAELGELEKPLAGILEALQGEGELPDMLVELAAHIDWDRKLVLAIYPPAGAGRPGLLAFVPAANTRTAEKAILQASESAGETASTSLALAGYVMAAMGMEAPADLDFKRADMSRLAAYPASSVAAWIDIETGKEYAKLLTQGVSSLFDSKDPGLDSSNPGPESDETWEEDWDWEDETPAPDEWTDDTSLDETWDEEWDWETEDLNSEDLNAQDLSLDDWESDTWDEYPDKGEGNGWSEVTRLENLGSVLDGAEGLMQGFTDIVKDIRSIDFAVILAADRVWFRSGASVAPGGTLYPMSVDAAAGQLPLPYLPYLEADALVSAAWSTKAAWAMGMFEALFAKMLPDEAVLRKTLDALKASLSATGPNGAASFDLKLSDELSEAIRTGSPSKDEAIPLLGRGLSFNVSGVLQVNDRQDFRDAMKDSMALLEDPLYQTVLEENNIEFHTVRKIGIMDGMPYDAFEYSIRSTDEGGMASEILEAFSAIAGKLMTPAYVYRGDKAYIGFGSPESLKALIGRDRAVNPLQLASRFKALRGGAPADARGIVYLSTGTLMRRLMQIMPEEKRILPFAYGDLYGILGWFAATPGQFGFGIGFGAEDIKAFRSLPD